jgi:hypothetical protein
VPSRNVPLNALGCRSMPDRPRNKPSGVQFGPERQPWHRDEES